MVKRNVQRQLKQLQPGDLIRVDWYDASIGTAYSGRPELPVDVRVISFGLFIGLVGDRTKHIVLTQNSFKYTEDHYRLDYTLIPVSWAAEIFVIKAQELVCAQAKQLLHCFLVGGSGNHTVRGVRQRRAVNGA